MVTQPFVWGFPTSVSGDSFSVAFFVLVGFIPFLVLCLFSEILLGKKKSLS